MTACLWNSWTFEPWETSLCPQARTLLPRSLRCKGCQCIWFRSWRCSRTRTLKGAHSHLAPGQQPFIFPRDIAESDLVRNWLQFDVGGLVEKWQHPGLLTPVYKSNTALIMQHHSLFFFNQIAKKVERLDKWLWRDDCYKATSECGKPANVTGLPVLVSAMDNLKFLVQLRA